MRRLIRPTQTSRQALDLCIASIQNPDLRNRLNLCAETIDAAESNYVSQAEQATLYTIPGTSGVDGRVSTAEMERVYANTFVKSVRTRNLYDSIKKLPENDICPLCGQRTVFTLDHYLPQTLHPALVVTPANLLPSCSECNKMKSAFQAKDASSQTLHPYFDYIDSERWLFAKVQESSPAAVIFFPAPPTAWDPVMHQRIASHFKTFRLSALYASHSAVEINNLRYGLQRMAERNPPKAISQHLREKAESCSVAHPNSWQRATYEAIADSEWFCSGGFIYQ